MTEPYKKRVKAGFNSDKKISNRKERIYEKEELKGAYLDLVYFPDEPEFSSIKPVKKKPSKLEKNVKRALSDIHYTIKFSQRFFNGIKGLKLSDAGDNWSAEFRKRLYSDYKEAIKLLKSVENDDRLDNKLKARINKALILVLEQE